VKQKKSSSKKTTPKKAKTADKAAGISSAPDQLLTGWPKIAKYLGQPVSVAHRWAKDGLPVERKGRAMTAKPEGLSKWLGNEVGAQAPVHIAQSSDEDLLTNLRRGLKDARSSKRK
jgi:hypothetical protein